MSVDKIRPVRQSFVSSGVSQWRPHGYANLPNVPLVGADDVVSLVPGLDLWDNWPLAHEDGRTVVHGGRSWWFMLSAPPFADPALRHNVARIRLLSLGDDGWRDHGNALPDGLNPGVCEWAGCAVLMDDGVSVTLFYTVSGRRGGPSSFEQRLFACHGTLGDDGPAEWQAPVEIVAADGVRYVLDRQENVVPDPGMIKAFRDPAWFRDPQTGKRHMLFTGSAAWTKARHNGVIGVATLVEKNWILGDPMFEAIGVNNELERPNAHIRDGRYYVFWSTQKHTFGPEASAGPNGLYGMVADSFDGPWRPINGCGLVAANPDEEPTQTYSWWVTGEGDVWSFVDYWGMEGRTLAEHPELVRQQFGGTAAPVFRLKFDGDIVTVAN